MAHLMEARDLALPGRLQQVSLTLDAGEVLGIIGPNGSGKSSLLLALAGLLPTTGKLRCLGDALEKLPVRERARRIGFLPQFGAGVWPIRVAEAVALGRLPWRDEKTPVGQTAIAAAMRQTDVLPLAQTRIDQLSGGEAARVWLARILAGTPRLLLADEPLASLDLRYQTQIMRCLRAFADAGGAVALAVHDLSLAARFCDRLALMQDGHLIASGTPAQVLTPALLQACFGTALYIDLAHVPPVVLPL